MFIPENEIEEIIQKLPSEEDFMPCLAIDCIMFGYHDRELKVFCTRQEPFSHWYLPSGHIKKNEGVNQAAYRILRERTGVSDLFLKQFWTFGDVNRSLAGTGLLAELRQLPTPILEKIEWMTNRRYVSICYYA